MGPVADHLVGLGEPLGGGEHGPGVADRDVVAHEHPDPGYGCGEVDGSEHDHVRGRGEGLYEHFAVRPMRRPWTP